MCIGLGVYVYVYVNAYAHVHVCFGQCMLKRVHVCPFV